MHGIRIPKSYFFDLIFKVIVYWRIYTITKKHSRQRLKDTQRTDETLYQLTIIENNLIPLDQQQQKITNELKFRNTKNIINKVNKRSSEKQVC